MTALTETGDFIRSLSGWRARLFAFAAGALSALGFAPVDFFPVLLLGFAALVLLIDGANATARPMRNAAWAGWAFAFGQFLVGWHWIAYAFLVDPAAHAWQIPFIALLPAGLALYVAAACAFAVRFWDDQAGRIFIFAGTYAVAEWLRGHVLTGFPWNIAAYGWGASLAVMQSAALFGAYGLTLLTILFGASLSGLFAKPIEWRFPLAMSALFLAFFAGGEVRLSTIKVDEVSGVRLRIVQPNIAQSDKWLPARRPTNIGERWSSRTGTSS